MSEFSKPKGRGLERAARVSMTIAHISKLVTNRFVNTEPYMVEHDPPLEYEASTIPISEHRPS